MCNETMEQFDRGAEAWVDYNQQPMGRIRRAVTWHNLSRHLPHISDPDQPPFILDVGGGSGELALQLVQHGYRVCLVDYASSMLDQARLAARALAGGAAELLTLLLLSWSQNALELISMDSGTARAMKSCCSTIQYTLRQQFSIWKRQLAHLLVDLPRADLSSSSWP